MIRPKKYVQTWTLLVMGPFYPILAIWTNNFHAYFDLPYKSQVANLSRKTLELSSDSNPDSNGAIQPYSST